MMGRASSAPMSAIDPFSGNLLRRVCTRSVAVLAAMCVAVLAAMCYGIELFCLRSSYLVGNLPVLFFLNCLVHIFLVYGMGDLSYHDCFKKKKAISVAIGQFKSTAHCFEM